MPGFQPSKQTIRLYPKATSSLKARLNYTSPSGLKTQEGILHVISFFLPNKKLGEASEWQSILPVTRYPSPFTIT